MRFVIGFLAALAVVVLVAVVMTGDRLGDQETVGTDDPADSSGLTSQPSESDPTPTPDAGSEGSDQDAETTAPAEVATATAAPTNVVTMAFTGDILSHGSVIAEAGALGTPEQPYDYEPMFRNVTDRLAAADLSFCVLETPVSSDNTELSGYPIFNAPRELPDGLVAAGFDGCAVASNHAYDRGPTGVLSTAAEMDRAGLGRAGIATSAAEQNTPKRYEVGDMTVAHLSYTYGLNGFVLPADRPYLINVTEVNAVLAEARRARDAGVDFVVLHLQWGNEYQSDPSTEQLELAQTFTSSPDIDLIVGNHVHVIQPVDIVNGKYVIYGVGNFLSNQSAECCPAVSQNGVIMSVTVAGTAADGYEVIDVTYTPTRVDRSDYSIVSLPEALADPSLDPGLRAVYEESMAATTEVVNRLGAALEPTTAP